MAIGTVVARMWARVTIQHRAGLDDWLMLVSLAPTIGLIIGVGVANEKLFNRHIWDNKPSEWLSQRKITWALELLYIISSGMVKASVLLFYRRMGFKSVSNVFRITTVVSLVSVVLFTTGYLFALFFSCSPLHAFWDQLNLAKVAGGFEYRCGNEFAHLLSAGIISTVQDFIATTLPAILCWNLQISLKQKIALYACFGFGYLVTIISAVRCYFTSYIFLDTYDVPWYAWYAWMLTALEVGIGTVSASIPALKVFLKHVNGGIPLSSGYGAVSRMTKIMISPIRKKESIDIALDEGYTIPG
ncbi:hypothetical protein N0V90_001073 [Kalmusia sp. IMI 367209]|nr:hypothetical protein N0V90_001073 [Kalmusia sp. IMI 367209]